MKEGRPEENRIAELEAEVEQLRAQLLLNNQAMLTVGGIEQSALPPSNFTIMGLEESVLLLDEQDVIRFANTEFAVLLGFESKHQLLRNPLADCDQGPLGQGFMSALVSSTRMSGQTNTIERTFQGVPGTPATDAIAGETVLRFVAHCIKGKVQVVVQDVTRLRWLENTFSRYVSPEVVSQLMTIPPESLMKVERRVVTVLFSDLRKFTSLLEQLGAGQVCELLNEHFEQVVKPIQECQGTVDKFAGDGVMAIFGAPLGMPNHVLYAFKAAVGMQNAHQAWLEERKARGLPGVGMGIGIACGEVIIGNIGSPDRMDYTVLGSTVNLASRLCGAAKGGEVLTDEGTYHKATTQFKGSAAEVDLPRIKFDKVGQMGFKNISHPVNVIQVIGV